MSSASRAVNRLRKQYSNVLAHMREANPRPGSSAFEVPVSHLPCQLEALEPRLLLTTVTLNPVADAFVSNATPDTNWGLNQQISVARPDASHIQFGYLEFDLSSIPAGSTVNSAFLHLDTVGVNPPESSNLIEATNLLSDWTEYTVTWNNRPDMGGTRYGLARVDQTGWVDSVWGTDLGYPLADLIESWIDTPTSNHGVALRPIDDGVPGVQFASREAAPATWSYLIIDYSTPTPPTNPVFTGLQVNGQSVNDGSIIDVTLDISQGQSFVLRSDDRNDGALSPATYNNITFSVGQFTSASDKANVWWDTGSSDLNYAEFFGSDNGGGPDDYYDYVLVESADTDGWYNAESNFMQIRVQPKAYTTYDIYVRTAASNQSNWNTANITYNPTTGDLDCTSLHAKHIRVNVLPADNNLNPPFSGAIAEPLVVPYPGNWGLGVVRADPVISASAGMVTQHIFTFDSFAGIFGITDLSGFAGTIRVPASGNYRCTFNTSSTGSAYKGGTAVVGYGGSAFGIDLMASIADVSYNTIPLYHTDLSAGTFITDVIVFNSIIAIANVLSAHAGDVAAAIVTATDAARNGLAPFVTWNGETHGIVLQGYLEANRDYVWRVYPRSAVCSSAWGVAEQFGMLDLNLSLTSISVSSVGAPTNTVPATPMPVTPQNGVSFNTLTPTFEVTPFTHGGDGNSESGYEVRVRDDNDRIVYDTGFIPGGAASHTYTPGAYAGYDPIAGVDRYSEPLVQGNGYHWHFRYRDTSGDWSGWSGDVAGYHQQFYVNTPPRIETFSRNVARDGSLLFNRTDFEAAFDDPDAWSVLEAVKVTATPAHGQLMLNAVPVAVGQEIVAGDLGSLVYTPNPGYTGPDFVGWNGFDGLAYAAADQLVNLDVIGNSPPIVDDQSFSVAENSVNGTLVGTVVASDPDAGQSLSFAITGDAFSIDNAGQLRVANVGALNFETMPSFALTVQVTDNASPPLSDTATITVGLVNVVEQAPVITGIHIDTGIPGDGITRDRTLQVYGTSEPGMTIKVYRNSGMWQIGTTTASGSGVWSFNYMGTSLADGQYAFTARAKDSLNNVSGLSAPYNVTVDGRAPTVSGVLVNGGTVQRTKITSLAVSFNEAVVLESWAMTLTNVTTNEQFDLDVPFDAATHTWDLLGVELTDGYYTARLLAGAVEDLAGNLMSDDYTFTFHRLAGDTTGDGSVDAADYITLKSNFGRVGGTAWDSGDLDGNGDVDFQDLLLIMGSFGQRSITPQGPNLGITDTSGSASDRAIAFADTQVGATGSTETFTLANSGDQDLSVTSFAKGGTNPGDFAVTVKDNAGTTVTGSSFAIPAGGSYTVQVTFTPAAAGTRAATITFNTDDWDAANAAVTLNMSGTATTTSSDVLLRDDFNGSANAPLDSNLWQVFTDTGNQGTQGGSVYQTGDGWAHVAVASEWTGTGFYTTQTFANVGQYHIEGKVEFTRGTNNADNVFMLIRNADITTRENQYYMSYTGPHIRLDIHPTHSPMQDGFTSVYAQVKNSTGYQLPQGTSNDISWSGTTTVVMSVDYNADTGQVSLVVYNDNKTQVLTHGTFTLDAQTRTDIGANFRVEMGMDGYDSYDHYWDYVEVKRVPVFQDEFSSTTPNAPLDATKWQVYTDTGNQGTQGGSVYQTGDGWAHVDVEPQWTGTGFYSVPTFANTGQYHIEAGLEFTQGTNNADNVFMMIRNSDITTRENQYYMSYTGPHIRFNIHPTHSPMQDGFTSVYITTTNNSGSQYPPTSTSNDISWSGTNTVVLSVDYNADTGVTTFILYNSDKSSILTQATTTISAQTRTDIGANFRIEMGMDGYYSADHYWDYIEVTRLPVVEGQVISTAANDSPVVVKVQASADTGTLATLDVSDIQNGPAESIESLMITASAANIDVLSESGHPPMSVAVASATDLLAIAASVLGNCVPPGRKSVTLPVAWHSNPLPNIRSRGCMGLLSTCQLPLLPIVLAAQAVPDALPLAGPWWPGDSARHELPDEPWMTRLTVDIIGKPRKGRLDPIGLDVLAMRQ